MPFDSNLAIIPYKKSFYFEHKPIDRVDRPYYWDNFLKKKSKKNLPHLET